MDVKFSCSFGEIPIKIPEVIFNKFLRTLVSLELIIHGEFVASVGVAESCYRKS